MRRMKATMKKDKSGQPPAYLKRNRASVKRRKSKQKAHDQDEKVRQKYISAAKKEQRAEAKSQRWWKKGKRDHVRDAHVKGNYTNKITDEPIECQRPRRKELAQYSQTEEINFGDELDGYYMKRERPSHDKETETEDYHAYNRRYRRSREEPYESDSGGRRYGNKQDRAKYEIGAGMDEYERDERGYGGRGGLLLYQSEPDLSGSEVSSTEYRRLNRDSSESWDSVEYKHYKSGKRRQKWPEYEDLSYRTLLPYDHNVYRYEKGKRSSRRPKELDYTYDSESGSETYGGKSEYDFEETSDVTEYTTEYSPEHNKDLAAKSDHHRVRRDDRAYFDDNYEREVKHEQRHGGFRQQHQVYVAHPEKQKTVFELQRSREHRGVTELQSMSSRTVFIPMTVLSNSGKSEMGSEESTEKVNRKAEKPLEQNVQVYAAADLEQANAFESAAKEVENTQTDGGSLPLSQSINVHSSQREKNTSQIITSASLTTQRKSKVSDDPAAMEILSRKTKESQEKENTQQKITPGTAGSRQNSDGSDPHTGIETQNRKTTESKSPLRQSKIALVSQEGGKDSENFTTSALLGTQQKSGGNDNYLSMENQYRKTKENIFPMHRPNSLHISQEEGKISQKRTASASLGTQHHYRGNNLYDAAKDPQFRKTFESFISKPVNVYTSQEEWNTTQNAMSSGRFSTQQNIDENEPSNPIRKSVIHIPSILKTRSAASRRSLIDKQSGYMQDKEESIEDKHEAEGRKSENNKQMSTRIYKKNEAVEDAQNSSGRKSVLQKTISTENPAKSRTLVRQTSGTEENIYSTKPKKNLALSRQISGTEENINSSNTNQTAGPKGMRKSNVMPPGTHRNQGSIHKNTSPQHSPGSTKISGTKSQESLANVSRKQTMVRRLFQKKKKTHSEEVSPAESEELNKSGKLKTSSSSLTQPRQSKVTNSFIDDKNIEPFLLWGCEVPYIVNLFLAMRTFLGLNIHDSMINVLNNGDD